MAGISPNLQPVTISPVKRGSKPGLNQKCKVCDGSTDPKTHENALYWIGS
jgi:hypothetical protein